MPEISFVFGPRNSFFFDCAQTWKFHEIPPTLRQLFNSSMSPAWRVASPYCLALAPQIDSPEPVWYVGCKTLDGQDKLFHSQTYFETNYPDLARWIKSFPNAARSCFVTFGQKFSYFACAPGQGSIWAAIPSDLEDKVKKSLVTPTCVGLGMKDAWFVLFANGHLAWNFNGYYSGLNRILMEAAPGTVSYVAISPYDKQHYFIAFHDRSVQYNFSGGPSEWTRLMTEVFDLWAAERARMQHAISPPTHQVPAQPYAHAQQSPAQIYLQPQSTHIVSASRLPMAIPVSQQSVPNTPSPMYVSPVQPNAVPNVTFVNKKPQYGVANVPIELPGQTLLSPSNAVMGLPEKEAAKKRKSFVSKLF